MISVSRNVSRYYNIPGRETVWGTLPDNCFDNHINNQREKLINRAYIYGIYFQVEGATIKDTNLLNILAGGVDLPVSVQKILNCGGQITCDHNEDAKFVAEGFFDQMNDLDPENKLVDLHMFYGASVCRKAKQILKSVYPMLSCIFGAEHTFHDFLKGGHLFTI